MKALVYRTLILNLSSFSPLHPPFLRPPLLLSAAGDDVCKRRSGAYPYSSFSSPSTSSFISSSLSRRNYDEEIRSVKIAVWWDFENCNIPAGVNVHRVANRITSALRSSGIKGPVTITAFGDVAQLSRATQEALTSTGICLTHVPHSGKNSSDRSFMSDILYWVSLNPPPAHFFLISGDKDFANILHRLRMSNYNILLASTDTASGVLFNAATIMWPWNGLVRGENVSARHFNYPPDGLYGSWYGHYKGVLLDDAFADADQPTTSQPEKSMELISESKPRPVPRAVVNGICQVLHSYPEGINLSELRNELKRNNIAMDKDFFGYKKFSLFLASLKILKFMPPRIADQQPLVIGTLKKGADRPEVSPRPAKETDTNCLNKDDGSTRNGNSQMDVANIPTEHPSSYKGNDLNSNASASTFSKGDHVTANLEGTASVPQPTISDPSATSQQKDIRLVEEGFIKKLWKTVMCYSVGSPLKKDDSILELGSSRHEDSTENDQSMQISDHSMQIKLNDEAVEPKNHTTHKKISETSSLPADKSVANGDATEPSKEHKYEHEQRVGLFQRMTRLWKSWLYGAKNQDNCSESVDKFIHVTDVAHRSGKALPFSSIQAAHELFLEPRFWDELESFFLTSKGRDLILKSKNRDQLLQTLQKEGPQYLKELNKNHLLQFGDILILEKKWVEEFPSQKFPFRLVIPTKENSVLSQPSRSHGISSIFWGRTSQSNLQKSPNLEIGRQNSNAIGISLRESFPPCNFAELKFWCQNNFGGRGHMEPEEFEKLFESMFNKKLCTSSYGYSNIQTLIEACFTDTSNTLEKKKRAPSRDDILSDCLKLLKELLEKNPTGFNISIFQPEFIQKYGYILDYETLGYQRLASLLQIMPGVMIESSYIRPSETLLSWPRVANVDVICASKQEGDKGKDAMLEENGQTDDPAWEELGPLSDFNIHGNGCKNDKRDNGVMFSPVSLSDEEYTDSEDVPSLSNRLGHCKQDMEDSSLLLHILNSWDSEKQGDEKEKRNKEGGVNEHHTNVNGLVDCSRTAPRKHLKFGTSHLQKYKTKSRSNSYYFVPLDADDKECCAESILGEIKRAGDLRRRAGRSP